MCFNTLKIICIITTTLTLMALVTSVVFSILSTMGCDFVRLRFEALNNNGIYFNKDDFYIALGFFYHQPLKNRNSIEWINYLSCYEHDEVSSDMFMNGNFQAMKTLLQSNCIMSVAAIVAILVMAILGLRNAGNAKKVKSPGYIKEIPLGANEAPPSPVIPAYTLQSSLPSVLENVIVFAMIGTAIYVHFQARSKLDEEGGLCDRDTYFPDGWYDKYPLENYREYAYFKFFHACEMGENGLHSIAAKNWQVLAFITSGISLFVNVSMRLVPWVRQLSYFNDDSDHSVQSAGEMNGQP